MKRKYTPEMLVRSALSIGVCLALLPVGFSEAPIMTTYPPAVMSQQVVNQEENAFVTDQEEKASVPTPTPSPTPSPVPESEVTEQTTGEGLLPGEENVESDMPAESGEPTVIPSLQPSPSPNVDGEEEVVQLPTQEQTDESGEQLPTLPGETEEPNAETTDDPGELPTEGGAAEPTTPAEPTLVPTLRPTHAPTPTPAPSEAPEASEEPSEEPPQLPTELPQLPTDGAELIPDPNGQQTPEETEAKPQPIANPSIAGLNGNLYMTWYGVTPTDERGMLVPVLYQTDYPQTICVVRGVPRSVASSGCGATSISMVIAYLTGDTNQNPYTIFCEAVDHGRYEGAGLSHDTISWLAERHGVTGEWITRNGTDVVAALRSGYPVIAHMGPGIFTRRGHYVVLRGVTSDGKILLNDPVSPTKTGRAFPMQTILTQVKTSNPFMVCQKKEITAPYAQPVENNGVYAISANKRGRPVAVPMTTSEIIPVTAPVAVQLEKAESVGPVRKEVLERPHAVVMTLDELSKKAE